MIGYLSLYYDINNFTDRTMVVLTTMLVIATITSSIESVMTSILSIPQNKQKIMSVIGSILSRVSL